MYNFRVCQAERNKRTVANNCKEWLWIDASFKRWTIAIGPEGETTSTGRVLASPKTFRAQNNTNWLQMKRKATINHVNNTYGNYSTKRYDVSKIYFDGLKNAGRFWTLLFAYFKAIVFGIFFRCLDIRIYSWLCVISLTTTGVLIRIMMCRFEICAGLSLLGTGTEY